MASPTRESLERRFARDDAPINYVYLVRDGDGRPLYVGIGRRGRCEQSARRCGGTAELLVAGVTTEQARRFEAVLIGILGRRKFDRFGILLNERIRGKTRAQRITERIVSKAARA